MTLEKMFCKCSLLSFGYYRTIRSLCTSVKKKLPRKRKIRIEKELLPTTIVDFSNVFGCPYNEAYKILHKHNSIRDYTLEHLERAVKACDKVGIDKDDILNNPVVLTIHPMTIEQHSMLLEEGGFTCVSAHTLVNYIPVTKKRISLLKAYGYIPSEINVPQNFLLHLEPEIRNTKIPREMPDTETSFIEANAEALRHYLMWRLKATPQQLDKIFKTYARHKHKSFRLIKRALDILELDVGFTKEKILKNGFLIHCDPNNLREMLNTVHYLGGVPLQEVIMKHPKVCMTNAETITKTLTHFKNFGISDESIRRCPEVFTLSSKSVFERLSYMKMVPEFSALLTHPRILRLVHYQNKARTRLEYLQQLRMKCVSLHILSTAETNFEKFTKEGADKTKGTDISNFLSHELGYSEQIIRAALVRHPYWCHVPLVAVRDTLRFLLVKGFTKQQIHSSIHIVLYPTKRVEKELESLIHRPELSKANLIPLRDDWRYEPVKVVTPSMLTTPTVDLEDDTSSSDDEEEVASLTRPVVPGESVPEWIGSTSNSPTFVPCVGRHDMRLDFCIYFLEKDHHFTGDGIWSQGDSLGSEIMIPSSLPLMSSKKDSSRL